MNVSLIINSREDKYVHAFKHNFGAGTARVLTTKIETVTHLRLYCEKNNITAVITSQLGLIKKLSGDDKATLDNYEGSLFKVPKTHKTSEIDDLANLDYIEVIAVNDLSMIFKKDYQKFLNTRFIKKLTNPSAFVIPEKFTHEVVSTEDEARILEDFDNAYFVSVDIETTKENLAIRS